MKVYDKRKRDNYDDFEFPENMEKILGYLRDNGELHVSGEVVEWLYRKYSHEEGAGWLAPCDAVIENFATWLDNYEL